MLPKNVEKILNPTNPKQSNRQMRPIKTNLSNLKNQTSQKKLSENEIDNFFTDLSYPTGSLNKIFSKFYFTVSAYSRNVNEFLRQHRSSSLHKKIIKNFERRQWVVPAMFHTISCDLIGLVK